MVDGSPHPIAAVPSSPQHGTTTKHIRGSSLLLVGRLLAVGLNFVIQVLIVRTLSQGDFGAFAYAISVVSLGSSISVFGLDKASARFLPIYHEQRDYNKLFGMIVMVVGTVLGIGLTLMLLVYGLNGWIGRVFIDDQRSLALLMILIALAPLNALDSVLVGLLAIFASPRAIFFRKHVLAPGLKLTVVVLLMLRQSDVFFLAGGYLLASALGVAIYAVILIQLLQRQGLLRHWSFRTINIPAREVFSFSVPLLATDLVMVLRGSLVIVLLGYFGSTIEVAAFRAVFPVAMQNMVVLQSFTILYMPIAARMFAQKDAESIRNLYSQTAVWMAVISFPIFVASFSLAQPVTILLFGTRYAESGVILALLSLGHYVNAALGFNGVTLRVFGKVRYIVTIDMLTAVMSLASSLLLIPQYGALGAAIATCCTLVMQNIFYQIGLWRGTGITLFEWRYLKVYGSIAVAAFGLLLVQSIFSPTVLVSVAIAGVVCTAVLALNRRALNVATTFPELLRFRIARRLFGT